MDKTITPNRALRDRARRWLPLGIWFALLTSLALTLSSQAVFRAADQRWHDALTPLLPDRPSPGGITIIDIDERSLRDLGPWPWPRPLIAQLAQELRQRGAYLQVWDMNFSQPSSADGELAHQLRQPDIIVGQIPVLDSQVSVPPHEGRMGADPASAATAAPALCSDHPPVTGHIGNAASLPAAQVGHIAATPDADGILRRIPAVVCLPAQLGDAATTTANAPQLHLPQLTLAAAAAATPKHTWQLQPGHTLWQPHQWLTRGSWKFALDEHGYLPIPWQRPHGDWSAISAADILTHQPDTPDLRGHIVLIGSTAIGLHDAASTPYHPKAPGVSIHAALLAAGTQADPWHPYQPRGHTLFAVLIVLGSSLLLLVLNQPQRRVLILLPSLALGITLPLCISLGGRAAGILLPTSAPVALLILHSLFLLGWQIRQQRSATRSLASQLESFLPSGLAHQIATQRTHAQSLGHPCHGTLAAIRISGLQRWVAHVDSLQGLSLIHALHTTISTHAQQHQGRLEHNQGDTFYLGWPPNLPAHEASAHALAALQSLHHSLTPLLERNTTARCPLQSWAAIEHGDYLLGLIGNTTTRRSSTLLGPLIHTITGMLALSEELDSPILIGQHAAHNLNPPPPNPRQPTPPLQSLGQFILPDQRHTTTLHRIVL